MNKMSLTWRAILLASLSFALFGCSLDDDAPTQETTKSSINLTLDNGETTMDAFPGDTIRVKVESKELKDIVGTTSNSAWSVDYNEEKSELTIVAPVVCTSGPAKVMVSGVDKRGQVFRSLVSLTLNDYSDPRGTFILNEGSVWSTPSEMSSLIYITPRTSATPYVYESINGRAPGACSQDMFESGGKYFVISQNRNPDTDGQLTIFDTKTLRKIGNYPFKEKELDWPTHVAVVDGYKIYIRDNKGIWFFNTMYAANQLTFIEGSRGARKNTMAVSNGKVFFSQNSYLKVIDPESNTIVHEVKYGGNISGIINADDDHLYVSNLEKGIGKIRLVNTKTYEVEKVNEITKENGGDLLAMTFAAAPGISAKGDTIYYSSLGQKVYRHLFSTGESKLMVDVKESLNPDHTQTYNTVQVNPTTGHVYMNTLLGFGPNYKTNTIYRFDMTGDKAVLLNRWENLTRFPAGIFFPRGTTPAAKK